MTLLLWVLSALVLVGTLPIVSSIVGYLLVMFHRTRDHLDRADPDAAPRVAVLVPAWNEAPVLRYSVDRMMGLDYPAERLRLVVVDDGSTDETPEILAAASARHPGRVVPLRRENGGQGKAHTLNHGLRTILADDWAEAVLITDADVVFTSGSIARMARHLRDPRVGAVTAFIREASQPASWVNRCIGYEYATAQLAARRAQNVVGAQACLAGGAQLHSRENLEAIGGRIDTGTLAEDTVTTLLTQLGGRRVVFDPHAECLAEEPASVVALWKQRLRWARGNLQVTRRFGEVFFRPSRRHRLWNPWFALQWYSTLYLPAFAVLASASLVTLWFLDGGVARLLFSAYWGLSALGFVFTTLYTLLLDRRIARRCWLQGVTFPGLISMATIAWVLVPGPADRLLAGAAGAAGLSWDAQVREWVLLAAYTWTSACMVAGWAVYRVDRVRALRPLVGPLMLVVGFGPLLCAVTFAAYVAELRGAAQTWEKTEKTGKVVAA
ncbi:glycosyltransferase family 2 protein [Rothia sp. AR01]|uniref:Glycosyltransferase family 2 protein n=1 Tax=Rothia santali TaxID=2949643 RepID=A0A9X2KME1_9MICC|nr:glycosyltransferase family 2 protein [Rothia santali]MCP3427091.1 glycosyltransferase family 2 protein [Rothia santali]